VTSPEFFTTVKELASAAGVQVDKEGLELADRRAWASGGPSVRTAAAYVESLL
jgi:hypothetical protein